MAHHIKNPSWEGRVSRYLKAELKREGVTYQDLAERLKSLSQNETEASIAAKLGRGTFSAVFFLTALVAIERSTVELGDLQDWDDEEP